MYLRTILELIEEGQHPLRARISERLGHSGPTVSQTVARMERDGLLLVRDDRHIELTGEGMAWATRVMRKHRLAERLLLDVVGLEWEYVHEEACRLEHVLSDRVEQKLVHLLKEVQVSPYGNAIPGLEELGITPATQTKHVNLLVALDKTGKAENLTLVGIGEPIQVDPELLTQLKVLGLTPGAQIDCEHAGKRLFLVVSGTKDGIELDHDLAGHFYVKA
jgi:DtxR family Mn-dependent transcriptional regulator